MSSLPHQLLLLELDDETGRSLASDSLVQSCTLAGAVLAELQLRERLLPVEANRFALASGEPLAGALGLAEGRLPARPRTLAELISHLGMKIKPVRMALLTELEEAGALRREDDRLWIVTWRTRWTEADPTLETTLVAHLRDWLDGMTEDVAPSREDLLLSLLRASKLLETVWRPEELEHLDTLIRERTERAPIGKSVTSAIHTTRMVLAAAS